MSTAIAVMCAISGALCAGNVLLAKDRNAMIAWTMAGWTCALAFAGWVR